MAFHSALLHATALARLAVLGVVAGFDDGPSRARQAARVARIESRVATLEEELRIKDARLARIPPARRPHHAPEERLAILQLRAATGWTVAETAARFGVTPATIASWMKRLDEEGPAALVRTARPINRFPAFVAELVRGLRRCLPAVGTRRIASMLARCGLHLARSTVQRLARTPKPTPPRRTEAQASGPGRHVTANRPNHVWHIDITQVPVVGRWLPWSPSAVPSWWPFCWHLVAVLDGFSRVVVAWGVFRSEPSAENVCGVLERGVGDFTTPKHLISDRGRQFTSALYRAWCARRGVRPRWGALGQHGSIAVIERFFRSLKSEYLHHILIPLNVVEVRRALSSYFTWYATHRPHEALHGATPLEVSSGVVPAHLGPKLEVRRGYRLRRKSRADPPMKRVRGRLEATVAHLDGVRQLPIVGLRRGA
jgi:transposase InsO family protein